MGSTASAGGAPRGRQREAEVNDTRLLRAAAEVFAEQGWDAPVSAIARRAGIGMGSLYRRYPSKEDLAQHMRIVRMQRLTELARVVLAAAPDPWSALARFLRQALSAQGPSGTLLPLLGGLLPRNDAVTAAAEELRAVLHEMVSVAHDAGVLRSDFTAADIPLLLDHLAPRIPAASERTTTLHLRYLELILAGLRSPAAASAPAALPGPAPQWSELSDLWNGE